MKPRWRLIINSLWRRPVAPFKHALPYLREWFTTPMGAEILAQEQAFIRQRIEEFRGEVRIQSSSAKIDLMGIPTPRFLPVTLLPDGYRSLEEGGSEYSPLPCDLEAIPLPSDSVDLLILHHTLEFSSNPHQVLREAVRVLSPQGHLLVVAFNPRSLLGLRRWCSVLFSRKLPWAHHPLSIHRVSDWLSLMNCEPAGVGQGFYQLPVQQNRVLRWFSGVNQFLSNWGVPGGGFFILHASKYRYAGMQRREERSRTPQMANLSLVGGTASTAHRKQPVDSGER